MLASAAGVVPPDFILEKSIVGMQAFIKGGAAENVLVTTLPARLANARGRFAEWRSKRACRTERIPPALWKVAARCAAR